MIKVLESERIYYVKVSDELIDDYLIMINDPDVSKFIQKNPRVFSYEEEQKWVMEQLEKENIIFSMIEKQTGEFIGNIEITDIKNNIGELGISITSKKQNKHYGTEAMKTIIEYGFNSLKLDGFILNVYSNNPRAIHCYKNLGFMEYGIYKNTKQIGEEQIDSIQMKLQK